MFSLPYMRIIVPVLAVVGIGALGAYINLTLKEARYLYSGPVIISVQGEGEVFARPDVATFSFSVTAEGEDASIAQDQSAETMNEILSYLEEEGIAEEDIKTQYYNLNPRYEYIESVCVSGRCSSGERVLRGYEVTQSVRVKVRETDMAGDLISGVGSRGATNVSGLQFTIDDESNLLAEAREQAIADAKAKAERLAESLGVRIVRMSGFWEDQSYPYGYGGDVRMESMALSADAGGAFPELPTGENSYTARVNISYEVR